MIERHTKVTSSVRFQLGARGYCCCVLFMYLNILVSNGDVLFDARPSVFLVCYYCSQVLLSTLNLIVRVLLCLVPFGVTKVHACYWI